MESGVMRILEIKAGYVTLYNKGTLEQVPTTDWSADVSTTTYSAAYTAYEYAYAGCWIIEDAGTDYYPCYSVALLTFDLSDLTEAFEEGYIKFHVDLNGSGGSRYIDEVTFHEYTQDAITYDNDGMTAYDSDIIHIIESDEETGTFCVEMPYLLKAYLNEHIGETAIVAVRVPTLAADGNANYVGYTSVATISAASILYVPPSEDNHGDHVMECEVSDRHHRGATALIRSYIASRDGEAVTPTSVTITLYDADGEAILEDTAVSATTTGIYDYYYNIPAGAALGIWYGHMWITDSTYTTKATFSFEVVA